jgi:hypothetical protein
MEIVNVDDFANEELAAGVRLETAEARHRHIA